MLAVDLVDIILVEMVHLEDLVVAEAIQEIHLLELLEQQILVAEAQVQ
jgi:hypothetical protein